MAGGHACGFVLNPDLHGICQVLGDTIRYCEQRVGLGIILLSFDNFVVFCASPCDRLLHVVPLFCWQGKLLLWIAEHPGILGQRSAMIVGICHASTYTQV